MGGPLAPDSTRVVSATLVSLERSRAAPPEVRSAAHCAMNVLRMRDLGQPAHLAPFSTSDLTVTYVCGSQFRVTNRSPFSYLAAVRVPGVVRPTVLNVQGTRGETATRETLFEGGTAQSVQLVIDDVTYTVSNAHQGCGRRSTPPSGAQTSGATFSDKLGNGGGLEYIRGWQFPKFPN
jgi:hypothetical protein